MLEEQGLEKQKIVPAGIAAKQAGYTVDYITRLARENVIRGQKVGGEWHVVYEDVLAFKIKKNEERLSRGKQIRAERKIELEVRSERSATSPVFVSKVVPGKIHAFALTLLILVSGCAIGATPYISKNYPGVANAASLDISFYENIVTSLYRLFSFRHTEVSYEGGVDNSILALERNSFSSNWDGAFGDIVVSENVPPENFDEEIAYMFSDTVAVEFAKEPLLKGVVIPEFKNGNGRPYHFELKVASSSLTE